MFKSKHNFHLNKSILILKVNVAHFKLIDERSWSIPHNHNIPGLIPARDPWYMSYLSRYCLLSDKKNRN